MGEFAGDEVSHGDEVLDAAIAAGASACLLKGSIHRFDPAVVFTDLEAVEYARKVARSMAAVEDARLGNRAILALLHPLGTTQPCATVGIQFIEPPDT